MAATAHTFQPVDPDDTQAPIQSLSKRSVDVAAGFVLALIALPLIVVLAAGLAISLRTWPFFTQQRIGLSGSRFLLVKLRTLPRHASSVATKYELGGFPTTRFAMWLRSTHLDELPQLVHVVVGQMSLVGPRPEMVHLHEQADTHFARLRTSMKPGLTGLWQVSDAKDGLIWEAPHYDALYVNCHSLEFDLWILWVTLLQGVGRRNAIGLDDIPDRFRLEPLRPSHLVQPDTIVP